MTKPDHLNRQPFIDLIKFIVETQSKNPTGYSIAIDGKWGCGKTFVLEMLEEQLSKSTLIFHYNAWENDFYEEPLVAILSVIIEQLNKITKQKSLYDAIVDNLIQEVLKDLLSLTSVVVKHFTELDLKEFVKRKIKLFKKIKQDTKISNEINDMLPLQNTIQTVRENLKKLSEKIPIVIIVDELDRCLPEYAIKVLERLHHIFNENSVIQIIAIDKTQLSGSIAKVFGREILPQNFDSVSQFADLYLQKFIDTTIPLNAGMLENKLEILNSLQNNYIPYIRNNLVNIKLDENFLIDFVTTVMQGVSRRTQEKIFKQVELCHKLTVDSGTTIKNENCTYAILIYEILSCIRFYVFHYAQSYNFLQQENNICSLKLILSPINNKISNNENFKLNENIEYFFKSEIQLEGISHSRINLQDFIITDTKTYLMRYFVECNKNFLSLLQNQFLDWIAEDKIFLSKFDEIVSSLT